VGPPEVPADAGNPAWPAELETVFWQRGNKVINKFANATDARTGGEGEWDSENHHGHTPAAYTNL